MSAVARREDVRAVRVLVELRAIGRPDAEKFADELRSLIGCDDEAGLQAKTVDAELLVKAYREELHPRDRRGRWARGHDGGPIPSASESSKKADHARRMAKVTQGIPAEKPNQPFSDFGSVYQQAEQTQQAVREFLDLGKGLQERLGAGAVVEDDLPTFEHAAARLSASDRPQVVIPPLKQRASAEEKLSRKNYGAEGLTDLNRASVLVKRLSDLPGAVGALRSWVEENNGWSLHEFDDGFASRDSGYRDVSVMLRSPNGHVSEIQFHVDPMWAAKFRGGHALYEELRQFDTLDRPLTPEEQARRTELLADSARLYDAAWEAA